MQEKKEWSRSLEKVDGVKEKMKENKISDQWVIEQLKWKVEFYEKELGLRGASVEN